VERIKGSETVAADVTDKLLAALDRHWGKHARPKRAVVFSGEHRCAKRERGKIRPRKAGMAWEHCPGPHIMRQQVNYWVKLLCATIHLEEALRHPHMLKHTRLCDEARRYKDHGPAAMISAVRRVSGHATDKALLIYLDEPEAILKRAGEVRAEIEKF